MSLIHLPPTAEAQLFPSTQTIWASSPAMLARTTAGAAAGTRETSSTKTMLRTFDFDKTDDEHIQLLVAPPRSYEGGPIRVRLNWTCASGVGAAGETVCWAAQAKFVRDGDALDGAWGTAATVTDDWQADDDGMWSEPTGEITPAGTYQYPCLLYLQVYRDTSEDNLDGDAQLMGVQVLYDNETATDALTYEEMYFRPDTVLFDYTTTGSPVEGATLNEFRANAEAGAVTAIEFPGAGDLDELDLGTGLKALTSLVVADEALATLDVSVAPALTDLDASGCASLATLTLGNAFWLETLNVSGTALTELDVTAAPALQTLDVSSCASLTDLYATGTSLETLTLTGASALESVDVEGTNLTALVADGFTSLDTLNASGCPDLDSLSCDGCSALVDLDVTASNALTTLSCASCALETLDLSTNLAIDTLDASGNALTEAAVDAILDALDDSGVEDGTADVSGGTNAVPSAAGLMSKTALEGKGWTVTVNS